MLALNVGRVVTFDDLSPRSVEVADEESEIACAICLAKGTGRGGRYPIRTYGLELVESSQRRGRKKRVGRLLLCTRCLNAAVEAERASRDAA